MPERRMFLRTLLGTVAVVAVAGAAGAELVSRGVLPGKGALDTLDGACDLPAADLRAGVKRSESTPMGATQMPRRTLWPRAARISSPAVCSETVMW